jgi:hypothetical protein
MPEQHAEVGVREQRKRSEIDAFSARTRAYRPRPRSSSQADNEPIRTPRLIPGSVPGPNGSQFSPSKRNIWNCLIGK